MTTNTPLAPLSDHEANREIHRKHQVEFDNTYISSSQIADILGVTRPTMMNGRDTMLPPPIRIAGVKGYLWHKAHAMPFIDAWKLSLDRRRVAADH